MFSFWFVAWLFLVVVVALALGFYVGRIRRYTVVKLGFPILRFRLTFRPFDSPFSSYARHIAFEVSSRLDNYNVIKLAFTLFFDPSYIGNVRAYFDTFPYLNNYGKGILTTSFHLMLCRFHIDIFSQSSLFPVYYAKLARKRIAKDYPSNDTLASVEREYSNVVDAETETQASFLGKARGSVSFPLLASLLFYASLTFLVYTWLSILPSGTLRNLFPW